MDDAIPNPVIPTLSGELRRQIARRRDAARGHVALLHCGASAAPVLLELLARSGGLAVAREPAGIRAHASRRVLVESPFPRDPRSPERLESSLRALEEAGVTHFVLLTRRNTLARLATAANAEGPSLRLDPDAVSYDGRTLPLRTLLQRWDRQLDQLRLALQDRRRLELSYEDDVHEDPTWACLWIRDFLGLPQTPPTAPAGWTPRQAPSLVGDARIQAHLAGTRWAWMAPLRADPFALSKTQN